MRPLSILIVLALSSMALSCEKEPITFAEEEAMMWRNSQDPPEVCEPWAKFTGNIILVQKPRPIVPISYVELEVRKPTPPSLSYVLNGRVEMLGRLDPEISEEAHYGPYPYVSDKDPLKYKVAGRMGNHSGLSFDYTGICLYYPDGSREGNYNFIGGTGHFSDIEGNFTAVGRFIEKEGRTVMTIEGKVRPAIFPE